MNIWVSWTEQGLAWLGILACLVGVWQYWKLKQKTEDLIQQSQATAQQLRALMGLSGDWYWQQNAAHAITDIVFRGQNQPAAPTSPALPFHGLARWSVEGLRCIDTRYDWNAFKALLEQHAPFDRVCFEYWPQGKPRLIFESTGRPIYTHEQVFDGYMGVSSDLTQKMLNEYMLSLQRTFLQGVLLSVPFPDLMASYAQGLKGCLTHHADVLMGYRDRANHAKWHLRGSNPQLHLSEDKGNAGWQHFDQYCEPLSGVDVEGLIRLGRLKPEHYFESAWQQEQGIASVWVAIHQAQDENQPEYWVFLAQYGTADICPHDVQRVLTAIRLLGLGVERRVFEDDLQALNINLESLVEERTLQLQRSNAELEAFAYTVSHDLRAPLRAIAGFSKILIEEHQAHLPEPAENLLKRITHNTQQMTALINGLLEFSKLLKTELVNLDVNQQHLIADVFDQLNVNPSGWIHVQPLPTVQADPMLLRQVWLNLIENAIKFSSKVSRPSIHITCEVLPNNRYRFAVHDNGAGFDERYVNKLFNVFERLHFRNEFEGTGVGLAIVRRIVERHGGDVFAHSQFGQGAQIGFTWPVDPTAHSTLTP